MEHHRVREKPCSVTVPEVFVRSDFDTRRAFSEEHSVRDAVDTETEETEDEGGQVRLLSRAVKAPLQEGGNEQAQKDEHQAGPPPLLHRRRQDVDHDEARHRNEYETVQARDHRFVLQAEPVDERGDGEKRDATEE